MAIALGYLYSSVSTTLITPTNSRAVLAAACLLGGMDDLCQRAYEICKESISLDNIPEWIAFLSPSPPTPSVPSTPLSSVPSTPLLESRSFVPGGPLAVLGSYASRLYEDVLNFLTATLPLTLQAFAIRPPATLPQDGTNPPAESGYDQLLRVYTMLPFEIFKAAVESSVLPVGVGEFAIRYTSVP